MWITEYVAENSFSKESGTLGAIRAADGGKVSVSASADLAAAPLIVPYGIAYVPPQGATTLVMPTQAGSFCLGVTADVHPELSSGELMLFSSGGASIVLKNDGRVLINGREVG